MTGGSGANGSGSGGANSRAEEAAVSDSKGVAGDSMTECSGANSEGGSGAISKTSHGVVGDSTTVGSNTKQSPGRRGPRGTEEISHGAQSSLQCATTNRRQR